MNCLDSGFMAFALCLLADVGALAQGPLGVVATGGSALSSDLVGAATGALSQAQVFSGPFSLVASDPAGRFVYAAAGTTLYGGTIDSGTGILTPIPGFPYSLPGAITALTVEARGRFLYVGSSGDVQAASIDPATGALTLIAGSPFNVGINVSPGASVSGLVSDGAGKYLYATGVTSTEPFFPALRKNSTGPAFLGRSPEDHKFGLGRRYALRLKQQVAQVLVSPPATQ